MMRTLGYQVLMNANRPMNQTKACFQAFYNKYTGRIDQKRQKTTSMYKVIQLFVFSINDTFRRDLALIIPDTTTIQSTPDNSNLQAGESLKVRVIGSLSFREFESK